MAAYPSFAQLVGSVMEVLDDRAVDRAVGGDARARAFYDAIKRRFTLVHRLKIADVATLLSFYQSNRLVSVTLTWSFDGATYTVLFEGPPRITPASGGDADVLVVLGEP